MLRKVWISYVFLIPMHSLSSLCVACIVVYSIYSIIDSLPVQAEGGGDGLVCLM